MSSYDLNSGLLGSAINDFHEARRKARLESLLALLRGESVDLLPYDEVRKRLRAIESSRRELEDIPLERIVGSVNRYTDFTRSFLPRNPSDAERWAQVRMGVNRQLGLPPIEAYRVGDLYFISDGHHRVSVARELGAKTIEGYVTPVSTRVPLAPGDRPDDLIIKAEYTDFLSQTRLDELRPQANLLVTAPGQYQKLLEHINVHRYFMNEQRSTPVSEEEAAADWYDRVYLPIANLIQEHNLLRDFPGRTVTDLYLWIMEYRSELSGGELGWEVRPELAADDFARRYSPTAQRMLPRLVNRITALLTPETLVAGPPPGVWRAGHATPHRGDYLFDDLMVTLPTPLIGKNNWPAVRLAIEVARREKARLTGLHVVSEMDQMDSPEVEDIRADFTRLCNQAGVTNRMVVEVGQAANVICERAHWVDLVVFRLNYPPPAQPLRRLRSGARTIIRRCSAPALAVPDVAFKLDSALLAYGPGPRASEALYLATSLAGRWKIPLTVVTVKTEAIKGSAWSGGTVSSQELLEQARSYLESHAVQATYVEEQSQPGMDAARAVLLNAEAHEADFIIMGGYEAGPLLESLTGSTVDRVLRSTRRPVLICR